MMDNQQLAYVLRWAKNISTFRFEKKKKKILIGSNVAHIREKVCFPTPRIKLYLDAYWWHGRQLNAQ